jgi:hypothetical protein
MTCVKKHFLLVDFPPDTHTLSSFRQATIVA